VNAAAVSEEARVTRKKCITRLHQLLADQGIVASPNANIDIHGKPRGCVYVLRFIPHKTLFELQPGFPKYFQVARRYDLLSHQDADLLVSGLAALGSSLRAKYNGRLIEYLYTGTISEFLDSSTDSQSLGLLESTEDWFPDLLHEQLPWPCVVDEYLMAREFCDVVFKVSTISQISANPIRALIAALGIVRTGHWLGLSSDNISAALRLLNPDAAQEVYQNAQLRTEPYAQKIVIPAFSNGFQGSVIALFSNLEPRQKERLRSTLNEIAHSLGQQFGLERKSQILDTLCRDRGDAKTIAEVVLQIASPVEHVVVSRAGNHHAYVIAKEEDYLAGYEELSGSSAEKLMQDPINEVFEVHALDPPAHICIKTLRGYAALDPTIHWFRIKTSLSELLLTFSVARKVEIPRTAHTAVTPLALADLDRIIVALEHQLTIAHGKKVAAKHLCFFETVKMRLAEREARLTNAEMLKQITSKLSITKVNGYQVTGVAMKKFQIEIEDLLPNRFIFENIGDKVTRVLWC
jgi:hypothetical protein